MQSVKSWLVGLKFNPTTTTDYGVGVGIRWFHHHTTGLVLVEYPTHASKHARRVFVGLFCGKEGMHGIEKN
jgi:hypothetical protein